MRIQCWLVLLLVVFLGGTAGTAGAAGAVSVGMICTEEETSEKKLSNEVNSVEVRLFNGSLEITVVPEPGAWVEYTKRGSGENQTAARADLKNIEVIIEQKGRELRVVGRRTDNRPAANSGVSARLKIPRQCVLKLATSNAAIKVQGPVRDVTAESSNGEVWVGAAAGQIRLETSNAGITAEGCSGTLRLETANGRIVAAGREVSLQAETSNGNLEFRGLLAKGSHRMETSNGEVVVALPGDFAFHLDAETSNGEVVTAFDIPRQDPEDLTALAGSTPGKPQAALVIRNSNGDIRVLKNQGD